VLTSSVRSIQAQLSRLLAWRKSSSVLSRMSPGRCRDELMRYSTLKIEIVDDSLRSLPVGGTFQASPEGRRPAHHVAGWLRYQIPPADPGQCTLKDLPGSCSFAAAAEVSFLGSDT